MDRQHFRDTVCLLLKHYFSGLAFVTKLAVREDFLVDDVDGSLQSKDVECASDVDDKECRVSLDMDISDTDNGMRQRFFCLYLGLLILLCYPAM